MSLIALLFACQAPDPVVVRVALGDALAADLSLAIDVWTEHPRDTVDLVVDRADLGRLRSPYRVWINDLDAAVARSRPRGVGGFFYDDWRDLEAFEAHLDHLAARFPDLATVETLGTSVEGRAVRGLLLGAGKSENRPGVLITGLQHAREWAAAASVLYAAETMLETYREDPAVTALLDRDQVLLVPIVNPDGYRYSWTTDRMWRKNRRDNGDGTFGVDLNRNWGFGWGLDAGSHAETSGNNYRGTAPFSEPETDLLRAFVEANPSFDRHVDVHTFGQLALYPWAFQAADPPDAVLAELAADAADAMASVEGRAFDSGQSWHRQYPASGTINDWAYGAQGMWSVLFELRDRGEYGFLLPPELLLPTAREAYAGLLAVASTPEPARLWLEPPALVAGAPATLRVWRVPPGAAVSFWASTEGEATVRDGPPIAVGVGGWYGDAGAAWEVPAAWAGEDVWLQAAVGERASTVAVVEVAR